MQLNELPAEGQPEARSLSLLLRRPDLTELLEHRFLILRSDADAGLANSLNEGGTSANGRINVDGCDDRRARDHADLMSATGREKWKVAPAVALFVTQMSPP
jgi:hypothetical protein